MPQSPFFFPDTTVLINMALLGYVDHLRAFVQGRGRWCATIAWEWRQSRDELSLHSADAAVRATCGEVLYPQDREHIDIEAVCRCLGTVDLLAYFEVMGKTDRRRVHEDLNALRRNDRHVRPADPAGYDRLVARLWATARHRGTGRRG